jgi:hypothetical protein
MIGYASEPRFRGGIRPLFGAENAGLTDHLAHHRKSARLVTPMTAKFGSRHMVDDSNLARIVHRLLTVRSQGDPTIEMIEFAVPNLRRMDELNRLGFDRWQHVASTLNRDQLELLTKIMIIAEREFNLVGRLSSSAHLAFSRIQ